ncbi:Mitogen-activated protein kinase kinase kinase 3 [Zea mays]|uniref:mitogen-activated protein kinase kinase kinase n=1 Tax=Zea mays TaxID=4577 RepID=A0A3L6EN91_MAIZE|nr:Mitogen-activated protein kinase kinase kinase 3 [Zea mays]
MPFWWLRRRSRPSSKRKDGPVPASASASCSPRHSVVVPPTAYASASASPSAQWEREWTRSLVSLAPRGAADRAAAAAVTLCGGGGSGPGGATAGLGRALPLPRPVYKLAPVSSGSSSDSDEVVDNTNFRCVDPFVYPGARTVPPDAHKRTAEEKHLVSCSAPPPREHQKFFEVPVTNAREVHLQSYEAATSGTTLRGRMFHKNTRARTRSLSPGPRGHDFASSFASPRDVGVSSRSVVKRMDDLNSQSQPFFASSLSQPLPRPPAHIASCPIPSSPIASAQSQSQWKKGKALGSGTFGQVYVGFNSEIGKFCAIKEVQVILDDSKSKERLRQLNQEVDMLTQLTHQNIVQYYGSELTDEALSIYLEYVSGGSIDKLLKDYGPFKEPVIRNYTKQILSGLAYLHGRKTVHRDVKGANVLVGPNGEVKLADFGMAKHITSLAEIHSLRGSPYWMAPEVIMNKNGYSFEVDIWSLGCTIIEMGTGRHPWHQYEHVHAMFKIVNTKDMPEIPERLSKEGKDFLSLCLKRDPAQRPSATQLLRHPFVQDNQAISRAKCNTTLRNGLSSPAEACYKKVAYMLVHF